MSNKVNEIYCAIHRGYNRQLVIGENNEGYEDLIEESYKKYVEVQLNQQKIFTYISQNPNTILFYVPFILNLDKAVYVELPIFERNLVENYFFEMVELRKRLGDRFIILSDSKLAKASNENASLLKRFLNDCRFLFTHDLQDNYLNSKVNFKYNNLTTKVIAFGEYTNQCVKIYGETICQGLKIPSSSFIISQEASLRNIDLIHEMDNETHHWVTVESNRKF